VEKVELKSGKSGIAVPLFTSLYIGKKRKSGKSGKVE